MENQETEDTTRQMEIIIARMSYPKVEIFENPDC